MRHMTPDKRKKFFCDQHGFTIVELLIAFAVFAVLAVAVTPVFKQASDFWQGMQGETELRQSLNSALQLISGELRQADAGSVRVGTDPVVSYTVNGQPRSFSLVPTPGKPQAYHIESADGTAVTPASLVNVTGFTVSPGSAGYEIFITARYEGINAVRPEYETLTVTTAVYPRSGQ